jgi:hypothetical protein
LSKEAEEENPQGVYDTRKAASTFGINFRTFDELIKDYTSFAFSYGK